MKDELAEHDFEGISALIKKEEEDALAFFRTRNFQDRLESRLKAADSGKHRPSHPLIWAVPVLTAGLVAIMIGTYVWLIERPASGPAPEFRTLASALAQLPGFSHSLRREWTSPAEKMGTFLLAESVRQALVKAEQIKSEEEQSVSVSAAESKVPRLSLDEKMKILFQEKTIERALLLFRNDSKEV